MTICENDYKRQVATQRRWRVANLLDDRLFTNEGGDVSMNPGGTQSRLAGIVRTVPFFGPEVERLLRRVITFVDHLCAIICSKLFMR